MSRYYRSNRNPQNKWRSRQSNSRENDTTQYNRDCEYFTTVDGAPVRKLFVGNLPTSADSNTCKASLTKLFENYGRLLEVSVVQRPGEKPFAFVTFCTPQEAAKALWRNGQINMFSQKLYLSPADSWHQPVELPDGSLIHDKNTLEMHSLAKNFFVFKNGRWTGEFNLELKPKAEEETNEADDEGEEEEENSDVEPQQQETTIHNLNDDCLQLIFDLLSVEHRLTLNRVCDRWRKLNASYWNNIKKLDFTAPPLAGIVLNDRKLNYFLHLCPNVTSLNIAKDESDLTSNAIIIIGKHCKFLQEIHMRNIVIQKRSLAFLAYSCISLKSFSMDACYSRHDGEMVSLVKQSRQLQSISLKYGARTSGVWLKHLQCPLRSLTLQMYEFEPEFLLHGIHRVSNTLRELSFVSCSKLRNVDFQKIVKICPYLTKVALSGMLPLFEFVSSQLPINMLSRLEILDLEHNRIINDNYINILVEGCPSLKELNISGIDNLTERGLLSLAKLCNLTHLRMACLKVTDNLLKQLSKKLKLKHLDISGCKDVSDEGCIEILHNCNELESLDLAGCLSITNETILAALNILSNSPTRKKLNIVCGNSQVIEEPWFSEPDTVKRLNIDLNSTIISSVSRSDFSLDSDSYDSDYSFDNNDDHDCSDHFCYDCDYDDLSDISNDF